MIGDHLEPRDFDYHHQNRVIFKLDQSSFVRKFSHRHRLKSSVTEKNSRSTLGCQSARKVTYCNSTLPTSSSSLKNARNMDFYFIFIQIKLNSLLLFKRLQNCRARRLVVGRTFTTRCHRDLDMDASPLLSTSRNGENFAKNVNKIFVSSLLLS